VAPLPLPFPVRVPGATNISVPLFAWLVVTAWIAVLIEVQLQGT
jgi:hypothetical protein